MLQDVHWSGGMFGYFPSYCLGNMMAAQFWYKVQGDLPGLDERFCARRFLGIARLAAARTSMNKAGATIPGSWSRSSPANR